MIFLVLFVRNLIARGLLEQIPVRDDYGHREEGLGEQLDERYSATILELVPKGFQECDDEVQMHLQKERLVALFPLMS